MEKDKTVDYFQAVRDFEESQEGPVGSGFMIRSRVVSDGIVDYLKVSQAYKRYLDKDRSEVIHRGKKTDE